MPTDLSHLPPSTPEEIRAMTRNAGLDLPDELMQQFIAVWPAFEAMVRRIPHKINPSLQARRRRRKPPTASLTPDGAGHKKGAGEGESRRPGKTESSRAA